MTDYSKIVPGEPPFTTHDDEIREPLEQEIESLRQQLAEYEGVDGRCKRGHNKKFSYRLLGKDGCVACEGEDALQQLAECQAREREKTEALRIVQAAICLAADDAPKSTIGKLYDHVSKVVVMPSDSTALDEAIRQANESARVYANQLTVSLHRKLYANETQWQPLPDLYGLLSQIDNMMCGIEPAIKQAKREALLEAKRRLFLATPYESTPAVWYAVVLERMAKELE